MPYVQVGIMQDTSATNVKLAGQANFVNPTGTIVPGLGNGVQTKAKKTGYLFGGGVKLIPNDQLKLGWRLTTICGIKTTAQPLWVS